MSGRFPPGSIVSAGVLAGAYPRGYDFNRSLLIDAARVVAGDWPEPLCRKVARRGSVTEDSTQWNRAPVDCPACLARLRRLGLAPPQVRP